MDAIVLASGAGSTFQAIIENCSSMNIKGVISDKRDAPVLKKGTIEAPGIYCPHDNILGMMNLLAPDLVVLAGYMRILPAEFVAKFPTINIHPSLLPKFKGLDTYRRVLEGKEMKHGTTIHWVNENLDDGPIIRQEGYWLGAFDTVESLEEKTKDIERRIYPEVIDMIATGEIPLLTS